MGTEPRDDRPVGRDVEAEWDADILALLGRLRFTGPDHLAAKVELAQLCQDARAERDSWKRLHIEECKPHINDLYERLRAAEARALAAETALREIADSRCQGEHHTSETDTSGSLPVSYVGHWVICIEARKLIAEGTLIRNGRHERVLEIERMCVVCEARQALARLVGEGEDS